MTGTVGQATKHPGQELLIQTAESIRSTVSESDLMLLLENIWSKAFAAGEAATRKSLAVHRVKEESE